MNQTRQHHRAIAHTSNCCTKETKQAAGSVCECVRGGTGLFEGNREEKEEKVEEVGVRERTQNCGSAPWLVEGEQ